jgi:hypothetical protein
VRKRVRTRSRSSDEKNDGGLSSFINKAGIRKVLRLLLAVDGMS